MRHVRPAIDAAHTMREFQRGWRARISGALASRDPDLPRAELVWLPTYLITIQTQLAGNLNDVACSIDARSGAFALFQLHDQIADDDFDAEHFDPVLDEPEAERLARQGLLHAIMRRRGRAGKPLPQETRSIELLRYPYWVYYHRRRRIIDIKVLDAATGARVGNKIKLGILDAFKASAAQSQITSEQVT